MPKRKTRKKEEKATEEKLEDNSSDETFEYEEIRGFRERELEEAGRRER